MTTDPDAAQINGADGLNVPTADTRPLTEAGAPDVPVVAGDAVSSPDAGTDTPAIAGNGGGTAGVGGTAGAAGTGGASGAAGKGGSGGSGGTAGAGNAGIDGSAGSGGSGGTTCQSKPRDCTSPLDNDCNGKADNQETTHCTCPVGESRACQEHPGYDGVGLCKSGRQTCTASTDKTTSAWTTCTGAVAPAVEVCDAAGQDEDCDGQFNEGCECVSGTTIPCDCGPAATCTNGKKGTCSVTKVTMYRDFDGDGYGDPARPAMVCPGTAGYVSNKDDCDDGPNGASFHPGVSTCSTVTLRKWCPTSGGMAQTEPCDQGCMNGICRNDGTVGLPGYVACGTTRCRTTDGCLADSSACGVAPEFPGAVLCDGPNDCNSGESCCARSTRGGAQSYCVTGACTDLLVCDPLASSCACAITDVNRYLFYTCQ